MQKVGLILLIGFLASLTIASIDTGTSYIPPVTFTALRLALASLMYGIILYFLKPEYQWCKRGVADMFMVSLLNVGLPFLSLATALKYISGSLSAALLNTTPIFTMVIAHYLLADERLNLVKIVGAAVAITGATILLLNNATGLTVPQQQGWLGQSLIIFASFTSALGVIYTRLRMREVNIFALTGGQIFAGLIFVVPVALMLEGLPNLAGFAWQGWAGALGAALCGPVLIYWLVFYMIKKYSASFGSFAGITTPFFSVLIGMLFMGEVLTLPMLLGMLCLSLGVWSLNYF